MKVDKEKIHYLVEKSVLEGRLPEDISLSLVRSDGITHYNRDLENNSGRTGQQTHHIGALVGGVWQASKELLSRCIQGDGLELRLSFDSSESGFFILPLDNSGEDWFLCAVYENKTNPGKIKLGMKYLIGEINDSSPVYTKPQPKIRSNLARKDRVMETEERSEMLFTDITDKEIDDLFLSME